MVTRLELVVACVCVLSLPACGPIAKSIAKEMREEGTRKFIARDWAGAIEDYSAALRSDPEDNYSRLWRGNAKSNSGDHKSALQDLDEVIRRDPNSGIAHFHRGITLFAEDDIEAALADFDRAIELDYYPALRNRSIIKGTQGKWSEALEDANRAVAKDSDVAGALAVRAVCRQEVGDLDGAIADLGEAIMLAPETPRFLKQRAILRMNRRQWRQAAEDFDRFIAREGVDSDYPRLFRWVAHSRSGDGATAAEDLRDLLVECEAGTPSQRWVAMVCEYLLGEMNESALVAAAAAGSDAVTAKGQRCEAWYYIGVKKMQDGDQTGAGESFRQSVATQVTTFVEYNLAKAELAEMAR